MLSTAKLITLFTLLSAADALGACETSLTDSSFIGVGDTLIQRVGAQHTIRVKRLPTVTNTSIAAIVASKRRFSLVDRIFSLFGVLDLFRFVPGCGQAIKFVGNDVVHSTRTHNVVYSARSQPIFDPSRIPNGEQSYTVSVHIKVEPKATFDSVTNEPVCLALHLGKYEDRSASDQVLSPTLLQSPVDRQASIKNNETFEYSFLVKKPGRIVANECDIDYRPLEISQGERKTTVFLLERWLATVPKIEDVSAARIVKQADVPSAFRDFQN